MENEAKIIITEQGAKQTQKALEQTGQSAKQMGSDVNKGATTGADATDKINKSAKKTSSLFSEATKTVMAFAASFLGFHAVIKLITTLNNQIQKTIDLNTQAANSMKSHLELGQQMVNQTGDGTQQDWAKKILQLQKTASFKDPSSAAGLMTSMDIQFNSQGGVGNKDIMKLTGDIAPTLAMMGLSSEQAGAIIKLAGQAGVTPDKDSFLKFFGKIDKGYSSSASENKGAYITGLQKGGTDYMSQGGSLEGAISYYSGALEMKGGNEMLSSTLLEQMNRIASGVYEKPRLAIEEATGESFSEMSMDQRFGTILKYAKNLPANNRVQLLTEMGVPGELASGLNLMASGKAAGAIGKTHSSVLRADSNKVESDTKNWLASDLARMNKTTAQIQQNRMDPDAVDITIAKQKAKAIVEDRRMRGESAFWMTDKVEEAREFADILAEEGGYKSTKSTVADFSFLQEQNALMRDRIMKDRADPNYVNPEGFATYNPVSIGMDMLKKTAPIIINYNYETRKKQTEPYSQDE